MKCRMAPWRCAAPWLPGKISCTPGEDVKARDPLFPAGRRLRPQDIGLLAALGVARVLVHQKPRVAVLSSGDEIVPITKQPPREGSGTPMPFWWPPW